MASQPAHFTNVILKNFRGFKNSKEIPLRPLTFIVGPNSSGKSSIFDSILFLIQSGFLGGAIFRPLKPVWVGDLVDLGSYEDTVYIHKKSLSMSISIEIEIDIDINIKRRPKTPELKRGRKFVFEFQLKSTKSDPSGLVKKIRILDGISEEGLTVQFNSQTGNLSCVELLGETISVEPQNQHPMWMHHVSEAINEVVSKQDNYKFRGQKAAWLRLQNLFQSPALQIFASTIQRVSSGRSAPQRWYTRTGEDPMKRIIGFSTGEVLDSVTPAVLEETRLKGRGKGSSQRLKQLGKALEKLGIASAIQSSEISDYHSTIEVEDNITGIVSKLVEVGYGASQVLPVIIACQSNLPGPLFIEQPEIHLHPRAQGAVAEIIAASSKLRQVVVETHSEHMINKARLLVATKKLSHKDVVILYVDRTESGSNLKVIEIDQKGNFVNEWPDGFFDERYRDTVELLKLASD